MANDDEIIELDQKSYRLVRQLPLPNPGKLYSIIISLIITVVIRLVFFGPMHY